MNGERYWPGQRQIGRGISKQPGKQISVMLGLCLLVSAFAGAELVNAQLPPERIAPRRTPVPAAPAQPPTPEQQAAAAQCTEAT